MSGQPVHPLSYAPPAAAPLRPLLFRAAGLVLAFAGVAVNLGLILLAVSALHHAKWAYPALKQNPRSFGREVEPVVIESLHEPAGLWVSQSLLIAAAALGLLLAVHLLAGVWVMKDDPARAVRRFERYRKWKWPGAAITAVALFWAATENFHFWVAATAHHPVGGGPPYLSTAALFGFALLPVAWAGQAIRHLAGPA